MDIVSKKKQDELYNALQHRNSKIIVVCGPPGSGKTHTILKLVKTLALEIEYFDDVTAYKNTLLNRSTICLTDIDSVDFVNKHSKHLKKLKNVIIETRTLKFINRLLENTVLVTFNPITKSSVKKLFKVSKIKDVEEELFIKRVNGNLHAIRFYCYTSGSELSNIFHDLGRLFYNSINSIQDLDVSIYGSKFLGYCHTNYLNFVEMESLCKVADSFSLFDQCGVFLEDYLLACILNAKKSKNHKFYSFVSCDNLGNIP